MQKTWFQPVPSLYIYQVSNTADIETDGRLAIFDLDWTLVRPIHGKFPKSPTDIAVLPNRKQKLQELDREGYNILIMSNQKCRHQKDCDEIRSRIEYAANLLGVPLMAFVATAEDQYRKPEIGAWTIIKDLFQLDRIEKSSESEQVRKAMLPDIFFVGDAAGRPQDFSDSDLKWAQNIGIPFYTPEEFFPAQIPTPPREGKQLILLQGMSGAGKSSFYQQYLQPLGYAHINKDTLKDKRRVLRATEMAMQAGQKIAIDETNPTRAGRAEFLELARRYGYSASIYYLVRNGIEWNKLRARPVPDVAYHTYFKYLEEPSQSELKDFGLQGSVTEVWF
jgi:bifunctional polynucleotide phosphatase/kinase